MAVKFVVKMNKFGQMPGQMTKAVNSAFSSVSGPILATMQGATPKDTGELAGSESVEVGDKVMTFTAGTDHAIYPEFGTRYMGAQPYMKPTVEGAAGQISDAITAAAGSLG